MEDPATEFVPLACVPGAIRPEERSAHFALIQRLFGSDAAERERLAEGYAFRFAAEVFEDLARFVDNERKCCPFLKFELMIAPGETWVSLRLTGPDGTTAFLESELPI